MQGQLDNGVFDRLDALFCLLKSKSFEFVDAASRPITSYQYEPNDNEFIAALEADKEAIKSQYMHLLESADSYGLDTSLVHLLETSVSLHADIENRISKISQILTDNSVQVDNLATQLPETLPVATFQAGAIETANALKFGKMDKGINLLHALKSQTKTRETKSTDPQLENLGLSKESMALLGLASKH